MDFKYCLCSARDGTQSLTCQHCLKATALAPPLAPHPFLSKLISLKRKRRKERASLSKRIERKREGRAGRALVAPRDHPLGLAWGSEGGDTHRKLGQHIGSGSYSNANHVLEPEGEHGWSL